MIFFITLILLLVSLSSGQSWFVGELYFNQSLTIDCNVIEPFAIQAFQVRGCYGGGDFIERTMDSNETHIIVEYFPNSTCRGELDPLRNDTFFRAFPIDGSCPTIPFDIVEVDQYMFWRPTAIDVPEFPPIPFEESPAIFGAPVGSPTLVRTTYGNSQCAGIPDSILYARQNNCSFSLSPIGFYDPSIAICMPPADGQEGFGITRQFLYPDDEGAVCANSSQSLDIPNMICIPGTETLFFQNACFFDMPTSNMTTILLTTLIPISFCFLCLFFILLATFLIYRLNQKHKNFKINLGDLGEIPQLERIQILEEIGRGNFGIVYKGSWNDTLVALKSLKGEEVVEFVREMEIMVGLRHPNVLTFYGVYQSNNNVYMTTEFMEKGDLLHFVQVEFELTSSQLSKFCQKTASGMEYLHKKNIIHRDLAARNLLVTQNEDGYIVKVADFGLSRVIENDEYQTKSRKIPIRWTSPESLEFRNFNEANDIWSFGVTMWEIYSRGAIPYAGLKNEQILKKIKEGLRLTKPSESPEIAYKVMQSCWNAKPKKRPSFTKILEKLSNINFEFRNNLVLNSVNFPPSSSNPLESSTSMNKSAATLTNSTPSEEHYNYEFTPSADSSNIKKGSIQEWTVKVQRLEIELKKAREMLLLAQEQAKKDPVKESESIVPLSPSSKMEEVTTESKSTEKANHEKYISSSSSSENLYQFSDIKFNSPQNASLSSTSPLQEITQTDYEDPSKDQYDLCPSTNENEYEHTPPLFLNK